MVTLHIGLLVGCLVEPIVLHRPSFQRWAGRCSRWWSAAQVLRWWCITTLGHQWNTRVIVIPGAPRVTGGPYRFTASELCRGDRRRRGAAVGAHRMDHRAGVLGPQRVAVEHADQSRERCTGEPDMIDLLVVGGGPAGLATALHGARAGLEVVVVERRRGPIDKACGEGLMPHSLRISTAAATRLPTVFTALVNRLAE